MLPPIDDDFVDPIKPVVVVVVPVVDDEDDVVPADALSRLMLAPRPVVLLLFRPEPDEGADEDCN